VKANFDHNAGALGRTAWVERQHHSQARHANFQHPPRVELRVGRIGHANQPVGPTPDDDVALYGYRRRFPVEAPDGL